MTPQDLRALASTSADFARCARFYQHALTAKGRTWLAMEAAKAAGDLADGHSIAAIQLDQAACALQQEVA